MSRKRLFFILWLIALTVVPQMVAAQQYKVGACDWMMLKRQKLGEFQLAHDIGCDGVEMDMGGLGKRDSFDNKMRDAVMAMRLSLIHI